MAVQNPLLVDTLTPETRALQRLGVWETGKLIHGNGDSRSPDYNSLTDFCFGEGCVEIRLPSLLLNVKGWKSLEFRERLKESYYMVQAYWKGGDGNASAG